MNTKMKPKGIFSCFIVSFLFLHFVDCADVHDINARQKSSVRQRLRHLQSIVRLDLINSITNQPVTTLNDGDVVILDNLGLILPALNIQAVTTGTGIGSVKFGLDGNPNFRNEGVAPYALGGDIPAGKYLNCTQLGLGPHTATATIFSGGGGTGTIMATRTVTFTIVQSGTTAPARPPTQAPLPPPVPLPVPPPTLAPVRLPTNAPVPQPTLAPVRLPTDAPVPQPTLAPIRPPTKAPVPLPVPQPSLAPVAPPAPTTTLSTKGMWKIYNSPGVVTRHENCFVMVGRKAYLIGGRETQDVDVFDPVTRTWSKGATAPRLLHHMQCVQVNNEIYFPAAWTDWFPREKNTNVMYIFNTVTNTWRNVTAMPEYRRRGAAAVVVDGTKIWVSHGNRGGHEGNATTDFATSYGWIDYYDTADGKWYMGDVMGFPDAPNPRDHTGGALVNGRICVAAGRNGGVYNWPIVKATDCFDPVTKKWNDPPPPDHPSPRGGSAYGTSCDGRLIVAGGERSISARVDVFNGTHWEMFQNGLVDSRHGTGLAVDCVCNLIYIAAGSGSDGGVPINTTEIYFPGGSEVACLG